MAPWPGNFILKNFIAFWMTLYTYTYTLRKYPVRRKKSNKKSKHLFKAIIHYEYERSERNRNAWENAWKTEHVWCIKLYVTSYAYIKFSMEYMHYAVRINHINKIFIYSTTSYYKLCVPTPKVFIVYVLNTADYNKFRAH